MKLIWNGHACFTLVTQGGTLVLDPYEDNYVPGLAPLKLEADEVYCSHQHRDHNARQLVKLSGRAPECSVQSLETYHDPEGGSLRGENLIHVICAEGLRAAHLGDLGCMPTKAQLEQLMGLDAVMIPVGGHYTIDAREAQALLERIRPRVVIPMHYRSADFGYDVIAPVEDFLALRGDVVRYEGNSLELDRDTPAQTALLRYLP